MIDFRYHIVSIVAVFLALALGLVIGATSLPRPAASDVSRQTSNVAGDNHRLDAQLSGARNQLKQDDTFDAALAPSAVNGRLTGQSIVVVSTPGVDPSMRKSLVTMLTTAGATVTGDVRLQPALLDPKQDSFLSSLAGRLRLPGRTLPPGSGAERAAAQLADVLATRPGAHPVSTSAAKALLSAYADGQLVTVAGGSARPASLAVVLAGPPPPGTGGGSGQPARAAGAVVLDLARDLDAAGVGAAIVGPTVSADAGGLVHAARADKAVSRGVSTVDGVERPRGQIAAVFALAEQIRGAVGSYGAAAGTDAPLPTPSP